MEELVSVVITTFNRGTDVITKAINTVKNQTYKNIEIIVVDDNGEKHPDVSLKIEKTISMFCDVIYIKHEKNKGACAARNTGIHNSKGEFVAFLDDDDTWERNKIELQMLKFTDDIGFVYCGMNVVYESTGKQTQWPATEHKDPVVSLLKKNYIGNTSCGLVRKNIALQIGGFDEKLKSGQDQDFWIRLAQVCRFSYVDECLVNYTYMSNGSITKNSKNRLESNLRLYKKNKKVINSHPDLFIIFNLKILKCRLVNFINKD